MHFTIPLLIAAMILFAIFTAVRESNQYQKALKGEIEYLVSRKRRNRRMWISTILLLEAALLYFGFFRLNFMLPWQALMFWCTPIVLIGLLVHLSFLDLRETRRDIDRIYQEAYRTALSKIEKERRREM